MHGSCPKLLEVKGSFWAIALKKLFFVNILYNLTFVIPTGVDFTVKHYNVKGVLIKLDFFVRVLCLLSCSCRGCGFVLSLSRDIELFKHREHLKLSKKLGELLFDRLKLSSAAAKRTAKGQWSTDEKTLSRLVDSHPVINSILEYRSCTKLKSTYVEKLVSVIDEDSRVHTTYNQAFTETGRLSSENPNLQNIPVRTRRGKNIRKAFVPRDENHVILAADYSQIELRIMAAMSGDKAMLEAFRNGEDIHRDTASRVYNVMPAFVTPEQRSKCKMVNFGIIYGISPFGLSQRLKISRKEATELIDIYFKMYPGVQKYMNEMIESARKLGYAQTILGRRRVLRDINSRNLTQRQSAERDAINTPIQGSAADLIKMAMVKVDRAVREAGLSSKMVLQIHDELVFDAPKEEAEELEKIVRREMTGAYDFGVPIEVSIGIGANWLEAKI